MPVTTCVKRRLRRKLEPSTFLYHESCPKCDSRDNLARYANGSATCFGCGHWEPPTDGFEPKERVINDDVEFLQGQYTDIDNRKLTKETCEFWQYQVGDGPCHIANYRDPTGALVGQKIRRKKDGKKSFNWIGEGSDYLYGMWLWGKGRAIVITEGEIDALSMSQAFKHKWPVVSLPNGAQSAEAAIEKNYEWLDGFDKIVLMFDQDEPGRLAAELAAGLLPIGKAHIAVLPLKDANEVLKKEGPEVLVKAFWNAKPWRPDGIVSGNEFTRETVKVSATRGYDIIGMPKLHQKLMGTRKGELTLWTAGSGIGKSTTARQVAYLLRKEHGQVIGNVFLEEKNVQTAQAYVALDQRVPLSKLRYDPDCITDEQWDESLRNVVQQDGMWFYNHFGSLESNNLLSKLRYLATVCKVDFIFLDHISIVTSGMESSSEGERKDIDILMTRLSSLISETGVGIHAVAHLKRSQGKEFNEGSAISLTDLRGSAALEQLSWNVVALERNQQSDDDSEKDTVNVRVLKCRETGDTGLADTLIYNRNTGWLEQPVGEPL